MSDLKEIFEKVPVFDRIRCGYTIEKSDPDINVPPLCPDLIQWIAEKRWELVGRVICEMEKSVNKALSAEGLEDEIVVEPIKIFKLGAMEPLITLGKIPPYPTDEADTPTIVEPQ